MSSINRYRRLEVLGEGGTGRVYRAEDMVGGETVALKLLHPELRSQHLVRRMDREIRSLRQLNHAGIVRVFDAGLHDGIPFLVLEFIDGETLTARVTQGGPYGQREAAELALALAEALAHAHDRGILHRDLKPDNVLLDRRGRPHVTDFGLALELNDRTRLTRTGVFMGTPGFLAPEQAQGRKDQVGPATDVYGIGGVLYFALTGQVPIEGENLAQLIVATVKERPTPVHALRPEVDPALEAICLRCLEKDPVHRFDRAAHLAAALRDYLQGEAPAPRSPLPGAVGLLAGVIVVVGLGVALLLRRSAAPVADARAPRPVEPQEPAPPVRELTRLERQLVDTRALLDERRYEQALLAAAEATALDPGSVEAWRLRAEVTLDLGEPEEALSFLARAQALAPRDARLRLEEGRALTYLERLEDAIEAFTRCIELEDGAEARVERALAFLELGRRADALEDGRRALGFEIHRVYLYGQLLDLFADTNARTDYERAVRELMQRDLTWIGDRLERCHVLLFVRPDASLSEARALRAEHPEVVETFGIEGRALVALRRYQEALGPLERALSDEPARLDYRMDHARALLELGRVEESALEWEGVLEEDGRTPLALAGLARAYVLQEQYEAAAPLVEELDLRPWVPGEGVAVKALLQHKLGDHEGAVRFARQALSSDPALEWPRVILAQALEALGRRREALATWREIAEWHRDADERELARERIAALGGR
ncbi:MAG: protein kinase [Planctomycetota bacterium]